MNNNEKTEGNTNDSANPSEPTFTINIPVTAPKIKLLEFLESVGVDLPILLLDEVNQINLQITTNDGGAE